jgi:hypothetical protein
MRWIEKFRFRRLLCLARTWMLIRKHFDNSERWVKEIVVEEFAVRHAIHKPMKTDRCNNKYTHSKITVLVT